MIRIRRGRFLETILEAEWDAVPARGARNAAPGRLRTLPLRHNDRGARSSLVKGVVAARAVADSGKRSPKLKNVAAERRKASAPRGGCFVVTRNHPWRAPDWKTNCARSRKLPGRISTPASFGAPPPRIFGGKRFRAVPWQSSGAKKRVARTIFCVVIAGHGVAAALARLGAPDPAIHAELQLL